MFLPLINCLFKKYICFERILKCLTTLHRTYQTRNVLHCIAHVVLHNIGGDENVKTLFFFSTKEVIIFLIPKFATSILKSLVITAIWLALNHISINDSFHAPNGIISGTSHRWHTILYHFSFGYKMKCICLLITASPANRSNKYCYFEQLNQDRGGCDNDTLKRRVRCFKLHLAYKTTSRSITFQRSIETC